MTDGLASAPATDPGSLSLDDVFGSGLCEVGRPAVREVAAPTGAAGRVRQIAAKPEPAAIIDAGYIGPIEFTIYGQPASKANSRQIVLIAGRPQVIKSKEALAYEKMALQQVPPKHRLQLRGEVRITLRIFYASERPDLDESVVLDVLQNRYKNIEQPGGNKERITIQAGVYVNDRQVREKHVFHGIDKANPRTEVRIELLSGQEALL